MSIIFYLIEGAEDRDADISNRQIEEEIIGDCPHTSRTADNVAEARVAKNAEYKDERIEHDRRCPVGKMIIVGRQDWVALMSQPY